MTRGRTLMIQGTASHVGKSVITAGLCRWFARRGVRVAPFKALNMSNNSFATYDGREIGRAQAVQATACGLPPTTDFNPILLKPSGVKEAQLVINGVVAGSVRSTDWGRFRRDYFNVACEAFERLIQAYDLVILEGAGSPAEINLRHQDIVNMHMARAALAPVLLVGDIERGGVFASLIGTHALLDEEDRRHLRGFVINKFRGEASLLRSAIEHVEDLMHIRCMGVLSMYDKLQLPEEDSVGWASLFRGSQTAGQVVIGVADVPFISNATDFERFQYEANVRLVAVTGNTSDRLDVLIFPGTKNTGAALRFVRANGLDALAQRVRNDGGVVLGICGGYQLLGRHIMDPDCDEISEGVIEGLGLLDVTTVFKSPKVTVQVAGRHLDSGIAVHGYEIHRGRTECGPSNRPWLELRTEGEPHIRLEGAVSVDGRVIGTSVHGLFESTRFREAFLNQVRGQLRFEGKSGNHIPLSSALDGWADYIGRSLNMAAIQATIHAGV